MQDKIYGRTSYEERAGSWSLSVGQGGEAMNEYSFSEPLIDKL